MRFSIENGVPYLISNGHSYAVEITNGEDVTIDFKSASLTDAHGDYSLMEVVAKCGENVTSIKKRSAKKKAE